MHCLHEATNYRECTLQIIRKPNRRNKKYLKFAKNAMQYCLLSSNFAMKHCHDSKIHTFRCKKYVNNMIAQLRKNTKIDFVFIIFGTNNKITDENSKGFCALGRQKHFCFIVDLQSLEQTYSTNRGLELNSNNQQKIRIHWHTFHIQHSHKHIVSVHNDNSFIQRSISIAVSDYSNDSWWVFL